MTMTAPAPHPFRYLVRQGRLERSAVSDVDVDPPACTVKILGAVVGIDELDGLATEGATPGSAAVGIVTSAPGRPELENQPALVPTLLACRNCPACQKGWLSRCVARQWLGQTVPGALSSHVSVLANAIVPLPVLSPGASTGTAASPKPYEEPWRLAVIAGPLGHIYSALCLAGATPGDTVCLVGSPAEARLGVALCHIRSLKAAIGPGPLLSGEVELGEGRLHILVLSRAVEAAKTALCLLDGPHPVQSLAFLRQPSARTSTGTETSSFLPALADTLCVRFVPHPHPDLLTELAGWALAGRLDLSNLVEQTHDPALALRELAETGFRKNVIYRP